MKLCFLQTQKKKISLPTNFVWIFFLLKLSGSYSFTWLEMTQITPMESVNVENFHPLLIFTLFFPLTTLVVRKKMRNNRRAIRNGKNRFCFIIIVIFYLFSLSCSSAFLHCASIILVGCFTARGHQWRQNVQ